MFSLKLDKFKRGFFDRDAVVKALDKATRKRLSRLGAFVMRRARSSIKKAPKVNVETGQVIKGRRKKGTRVTDATSRPGRPPFGHGAQLLRKMILFAYDQSANSVVIGPALINAPTGAPEVLEKGGTATITSRGLTRRVRIKPRPYMGPAFEEELRQVPDIWLDSVKG